MTLFDQAPAEIVDLTLLQFDGCLDSDDVCLLSLLKGHAHR